VVQRIFADHLDYLPKLAVDTLTTVELRTVLELFRALVEERCSIRDQRRILEAVLESGAGGRNKASRACALELLKKARMSLGAQIAQPYQRAGVLSAIRVPSKASSRLAAPGGIRLSKNDCAKLHDAVYAIVNKYGKMHDRLVLITDKWRPQLRRLLAIEFPALPVLAEEEIAPYYKVQSLAMLDL